MMIWLSENCSRGRVAHMSGTEAEQWCTLLIHRKKGTHIYVIRMSSYVSGGIYKDLKPYKLKYIWNQLKFSNSALGPLHQNGFNQSGYRQFLKHLTTAPAVTQPDSNKSKVLCDSNIWNIIQHVAKSYLLSRICPYMVNSTETII